MDGAAIVREAGFDGCIELTNDSTRVVLEPNVGGRVLRYQLGGVEILYQDPGLDGVLWDGKANILHPPAGRCDIGPEYGGLPRDEIWFGRWTAEIIGPRSARMTSPKLRGSGLQLIREFQLDVASSHLRFIQIIRNQGTAPFHAFHWGRTFAVGDGIVLAPLPKLGRLPRGYALGTSPGIVEFLPPAEPNVFVRDGILNIKGPPAHPKFAFDVQPGWLAYVAPLGLLFLKTFAVYPRRAYGELAANNASIWYSSETNTTLWPSRRQVVELEPIGPQEIFVPGTGSSFTENWWLLQFPFPPDRQVDLDRVHAIVAETGTAAE